MLWIKIELRRDQKIKATWIKQTYMVAVSQVARHGWLSLGQIIGSSGIEMCQRAQNNVCCSDDRWCFMCSVTGNSIKRKGWQAGTGHAIVPVYRFFVAVALINVEVDTDC